MNRTTAVRLVSIVRDLRNNNGECVIILAHPRNGTSVLREHICIRERDFNDNCKVIGEMCVGAEIAFTGNLDSYFDKGQWKHGLKQIMKMERL